MTYTDGELTDLIAEARIDLADADRCNVLGIRPKTAVLHRRLRAVTAALVQVKAELKKYRIEAATQHLRADKLEAKNYQLAQENSNLFVQRVKAERERDQLRETINEASEFSENVLRMEDAVALRRILSRTPARTTTREQPEPTDDLWREQVMRAGE